MGRAGGFSSAVQWPRPVGDNTELGATVGMPLTGTVAVMFAVVLHRSLME